MANLNQKIEAFIQSNFPDIDYSLLGSRQESEIHKMALNYEYFVNSIEFYSHQKEINTESIKQISTGDMRGIDGCFMIINNQFFFLPSYDDSEFFDDWKCTFEKDIAKVKKIDVEFIFIQSKSSKTELDKFKGFCDAVYDVFSSEESDLTNNLKVKTLKYVFEIISRKEHTMHLSLKLCSIQKDSRTISKLTELPDWKMAIEKQTKELKSTIFSDVKIDLKSGQDYQEKLEAILSPNQRVFPIESYKERFIEITNDSAVCYIGYLNLFELKNLLTDKSGFLDDVFFDNIRYFEGFESSESVNSKIYKSLSSNKEIFHLLHNGITITAHSKHFNPQNGNLEIKAFSIINGCQTSNIIWEWIKKEDQDENTIKTINIPVKIIISSNNDLRAKITETANTQNDVKTIQLIAISDEAKTLQSLFDRDIRAGEKLFYERLSNQYPEVAKAIKLQTTDIFRAFYSSFGKAPHKLTVGYGKFEKEMLQRKDFLGTKSDGQSKYDIKSYFLSAVAFNYLERYLRSKYPALISLRHHLLLLFFISVEKDFITESDNIKVKVPTTLYSEMTQLISRKADFESRVNRICEIVINHCHYFIDDSSGKAKVILKSYYTEEGTQKMTATFKTEFFRIE